MSDDIKARVYCIRNLSNGWIYIGITKNPLNTRLSAHITRMEKLETRKNGRMKEDYLKYGKESFSIELVENVYDLSIAQEIENYWIEKFYGNKCYNTRKSLYSSVITRVSRKDRLEGKTYLKERW